MKQLTIRNIPDDIARIVEKRAKEKKISLNKALISILEKATGVKRPKVKTEALSHDLDHLCGAWSKKEADKFEKDLESQRTIDEDLWKKTG